MVDGLFKFARNIYALKLTDEQLALLSAIALISYGEFSILFSQTLTSNFRSKRPEKSHISSKSTEYNAESVELEYYDGASAEKL